MTGKTQTYNAETAQMFQQVIAALERNTTTRQKQSTLQQLVSSVANGLEDLGQYGAAFGVLVGCGASVGAGVDKLGYVGGFSNGTGLGLILGGAAVSARVLCDLGLSNLVLDLLGMRATAKAVEDEPVKTKPSREKGLKIDLPNGHIILLDKVPTNIIRAMALKTARRYYSYKGSEQNFSQDQLGLPWGKHLPHVKDKLKAIGFLEDVPNSTMKFTKTGAAWLLEIFKGDQ